MKEYNELLEYISANGIVREDRTGSGTTGGFGYQMILDLTKNFPAVTGKKLAWKSVVSELLFFIEGSQDNNRLKEILYGTSNTTKNTIWTANAQAPYWLPKAQFEGDLGRIYGVQWRDWQTTEFIENQELSPEPLDNIDLNNSFFNTAIHGDLSNISQDLQNLLTPLWLDMIGRCYDEKHIDYNQFGAKGYHVDKSWLILANFIADFKKINDWELKLEYPEEYRLEKFILGTNRYSLASVSWICEKEHLYNSAPAQYYIDPISHKKLVIKRKFVDQVKRIVAGLKHNPYNRRHIISAWNPGELNNMALPPCHTFCQFYVSEGQLSCKMYQRSADFFLGVPFNIASYALLVHMFAQVCNLEVGLFIHTFGDAHIYLNHQDAVKEQLSRKPYPLPTLKINKNIKNIFDFSMNDFELIDYQHHESIKAPMAV